MTAIPKPNLHSIIQRDSVSGYCDDRFTLCLHISTNKGTPVGLPIGGWVDPSAGRDFSVKRKALAPAGDGTPAFRARSLVTIPTELSRLLTLCH
jgi:hypothetical protein